MNSFWNFSLHDALKKRVCRYLLQHYLGTFLAKKISLDQLTVDITKGKGTVNNIELDVQSLNEVFRNQNVPLEMSEGTVEEISVSIPWSALVSEPSVVEVRGLRVTLAPSSRVDAMVSSQLLDSMLGSMVTSMQVAETCVRETPEERQSGTEGVQRIANTIDTVLSKIRVTLTDSRVTLLCRGSDKCVSLQVRIGHTEYYDTAEAPGSIPASSEGDKQASSFSNLLLYKSLRLSGLALFLDDVPIGDSASSGPPTPTRLGGSPGGMPSLPSLTPPSSPPAAVSSQRLQCQSIKIAEVMGQTEVRLVLKREDHLPGPKFDCSVTAGRAIHVLLSPSQLCQLLQTLRGFASKPKENNQRQRQWRHVGDLASGSTSRPMSLDDRQKIEEQLLSTSLGQPGQFDDDDVACFGSDSENEEDEQFYSMGPIEDAVSQPGMTESFHSDSTWQPGKNWAAAASDAGAQPVNVKSRAGSTAFHSGTDRAPSRVVGLTGQLALLTITVLHNDPETTHDGIDQPVPGREKLASMSESFFSLIKGLNVNEQPQNLRAVRMAMVDLCPHDHLGFIARPLKLTYSTEESRQQNKSSLSVSMGLADLTETLFERKAEPSLALPKPSDLVPRVCDIVAFPDQSVDSTQPSVRLDLVRSERNRGREVDRLISAKLSLASCLVDVDLTLIDRLTALRAAFEDVQPPRYDVKELHRTFVQQPFSSVASDISLRASCDRGADFSDADRAEVRIESPQALMRLRFPVPDMRLPGQRQARWYKKVARPEWLELRMRQLSLLARIQADADLALEATCADGLTATLCSDQERIRFAEVWCCPPEAAQAVDGISEAARLHIRVRPAVRQSLLSESLGYDSAAPSGGLGSLNTPPMDSLLLNPARGATPFSSKRDIIGKGCDGSGQSGSVWESRVLPADPTEMAEFRTSSAANSRLLVELTLARCLINTDCQSNLELLYNRLLNDLALWQPEPQAQCDQRTFLPAHINFAEMLASDGAESFQQYASFKTSFSGEGSEDENEAHASPGKPGFLGPQQQQHCQQSDLCLSVSIKTGRLVGNLPLRPRDAENLQSQAQHAGALLVDFVDGGVFTVSGHGGNPSKVFTTVSLADFHLYHAGHVPLSFFSEPCFHQLTASLPEQLQLVLSPNSYSTGPGTERLQFSSRSPLPMLSLSVDAELKSRLKECSVALLVSRAVLHYRMQPMQEIWLSQLMNLFELLDYPIEGYTAPLVRTTLHVSFSDIAVDYRPTKLNIRPVLTVRSAYISSTVQLEANSSGCDFLIENVDLYMTDRGSSAKWKRDYAHIARLEVLELSIGMNDSTGAVRKPQFILNCSSRGLELHLCTDSLQALLSLVSHLANEGGLCASTGESPDSTDASTTDSQLQQQQPAGDNNALSSSVMSSIPIQMQEALSDAEAHAADAEDFAGSQDDLGFTIVDEPGLGLSIRSGDFEVKKISRQPIRIDDHFYPVPAGRADRLKGPKQLGIPLDQVTLRDFSFSVSLYGGSDFRAATSSGVSLAPHSASYSARQPPSSSQQSASGRRSDLCMQLRVHKLSVRHSRFPDDSQTLQRQVVIVEDVEILDKVATSPINSFLYRHTSERMPRQTNTPMVSLKLSHQKSESAAHKSECLLMISLQPVRLNVDQDAFYFLKDFFAEVSQRMSPAQPTPADPTDACSISAGSGAEVTNTRASSVSASEAADPTDADSAETSRQINLLFDELAQGSIIAQRESKQQHQLRSSQSVQQQLYFRCFVFSPEVFIRLDFNGGRFKPSEGALGGIALGLLHLNDVELRLKRLEHRSGLLGIDRLCTYALGEWVIDLREKQKGQVVRGLGPARVFLQLLTGLRDLVWLPVDSWMRHGLLLRGLQRGANSFASSSGAALFDLTGRILGGLQAVAALSQDLLSPLPLAERRRQRRLRAVSRGASGRGDFRDACAGAVRVIQETASDTAEEMRAAATEAGVVGIVRQLPGAAISPVVALTGAGHCLTSGAFNHLQPSALADERHKWKGRNG